MSEVIRMGTMRSLAKLSHIPYGLIRKWCKSGELPYIKSGKSYLVSVEKLNELINKKLNKSEVNA